MRVSSRRAISRSGREGESRSDRDSQPTRRHVVLHLTGAVPGSGPNDAADDENAGNTQIATPATCTRALVDRSDPCPACLRVVQLDPDVARIAQAPDRVLRQASAQEDSNSRRGRRRKGGPVGFGVQDVRNEVADVVACEGLPARQQLVHHATERPGIRAAVHALPRACSGDMYAAVPRITPSGSPYGSWSGSWRRPGHPA